MNGSGVISQLKEAEFRLDRVCRQFEQAWRQNRRLTIEHCLTLVEPVERPHLLEELIASEWELRIRQGDNPETAEYVGRFPHNEELVVAICGVLAEEYANSKDRGINSTPQPGEHLGDYKIIREVGRGGMGIVYEARQESLGRQVALKVLPARRFRSERELQRFRREAQAVARLHHSHIVEIYGVGEQDGVHYFAMRYVTGRGLDQVISDLRGSLGLAEDDAEVSVLNEPYRPEQESPSSIHSGSSLLLSRAFTAPPDSIDSTTASSRYRAVARIGFQVAEALQYAHERGIQHRDVKPSNLLIDRHEVVWLSDFGLAQLDLDAVDITESDDLVGTMKYMPPEALKGKIDHRSDIYSLGLTLYELITLRPALDGGDRAQLLEQVKEPQIPAPRWLVPDVPRDLETIILKAMARDLDQRYQSARELAEDLERFLNHEPIRARPQSTFTKFRRWVERKPLMAFLALGTLSITSTSLFAFGALYVNAVATAIQARQDRDLAKQLLELAEQAKTSAEQSRKAAEVSAREAQDRLIQAQRAEATTYLQQGDDFAALVWTAEALRSQQRMTQATSSAAQKARPADESGDLALDPALRLRVGAIMGSSPRIVLREWLPKLMSSENGATAFRTDGAWFVADAASVGSEASSVGHGASQHLCVANPERTRLLRWNLATGHHEQFTADDSSVFTDSGNRRIIYGANRTLQQAPLKAEGNEESKPLADFPTARPIQLQAAWEAPNGRWLLVSFRTPEKEIVAGLWDLSQGHLVNPIAVPSTVRRLHAEFSADSQRLLVKSDQHAQILDIPNCQPLLPEKHFDARASDWSRDGRWFAGLVGGQSWVYRVDSSPVGVPQVLSSPAPKGISFQSDGGSLALQLPRGRVAFYEHSANQTFSFQDSVHPHEIDSQAFAYSPDGLWYALAHEDGNVRIWNTQNHQSWTGILRHPGAVRSLCWSPGGELLVTSTQNGLITVWDLTPRATGQIFFHPDGINLQNVRFSPDGSRVTVTGDRGASVAWNLETGDQALNLGAEGVSQRDSPVGPVPSAHHPSLTPEATGVEPRRLLLTQRSANSGYEAVLDSAGTMSLMRTETGVVVHRWQMSPAQQVTAIAFNPDSTMLAAVGSVGLQVWDTSSGKLLTPSSHTDFVGLSQVCFSPDGRHVATVSENHVCQIRSTQTWDWQGAGFQLASRPVLAEFSPRDNTFVTATEGGIVQIWDWSRGEPLTPPIRHLGTLTNADLSADGRQIAIVGGDCLRVWQLPEPNGLSPEKIAAWAREVSLTDVNTADGTLAPLLPSQFPEHSFPASLVPGDAVNSGRESRCAWHVHQADKAHLLHNTRAEEFHIEYLSRLNPDHPQLPMLRARKRP